MTGQDRRAPRGSTIEERLIPYIGDLDACWVGHWKPQQHGGYVVIGAGGRLRLIHRVAYELLAGPIPGGLELDHLCRNRACFNPAHLEPVTGRVNVLRGFGPAAKNARKKKCVHGHAFTAANIYVSKGGRIRVCRRCTLDRQRRRRLKDPHYHSAWLDANRGRWYETRRQWRERRRAAGLKVS